MSTFGKIINEKRFITRNTTYVFMTTNDYARCWTVSVEKHGEIYNASMYR